MTDMTVGIYWFGLLLITIIAATISLLLSLSLYMSHVLFPSILKNIHIIKMCTEIKDVILIYLISVATEWLSCLFFNDCQFSSTSVWIYIMNQISSCLQIPRQAMNSSFEHITNTNYNGLLTPEVLTMLLLCADGFIWLRIGTNSGALWTRSWSLRFRNRWGIRLAED
jgi:hypothetical protein